jgi:hypothetical protein
MTEFTTYWCIFWFSDLGYFVGAGTSWMNALLALAVGLGCLLGAFAYDLIKVGITKAMQQRGDHA